MESKKKKKEMEIKMTDRRLVSIAASFASDSFLITVIISCSARKTRELVRLETFFASKRRNLYVPV